MKEITIYELELHKEIKINEELYCARVAGGWIYITYYAVEQNLVSSTVFVPYNEEFK